MVIETSLVSRLIPTAIRATAGFFCAAFQLIPAFHRIAFMFQKATLVEGTSVVSVLFRWQSSRSFTGCQDGEHWSHFTDEVIELKAQ